MKDYKGRVFDVLLSAAEMDAASSANFAVRSTLLSATNDCNCCKIQNVTNAKDPTDNEKEFLTSKGSFKSVYRLLAVLLAGETS